MANGIWVLAEIREGKLKKVTLELLSKAKELKGKTSGEVVGLLVGYGVEQFADKLAPYGADKVYVVDNELLKDYSTSSYAKVIADLLKEQKPSIFLCAASVQGKDLSPRIAAKLETGLTTDCIGLEIGEDGKLVMTRPVYAGKAIIKVVCNSMPQMASVRPNVLPVGQPEEGKTAEIVKVKVDLKEEDILTKVKEVVITGGERPELTEADIIVSGGRGMKGPENYKIIEELADLLGAAVGASRAAVDAGWRPHSDQVGQTGKTVSPTMYIACGISGAIQHLAGMSSSKYIVAVNKDPEAPIFKVADYGIVGDLFQVVPLMVEEIKKIKAQQ